MKKLFIPMLILSVLLSACTSKSKVLTINGSVSSEFEGELVYISTIEMEPQVLDSAVVTDGNFCFELSKEELPTLLRLYTDRKSRVSVFTDGSSVEVNLDALTLKGDGTNAQWSKVLDELSIYKEREKEIYALADEWLSQCASQEEADEKIALLDSMYNEVVEGRKDCLLAVARENRDNNLPIAVVVEGGIDFGYDILSELLEGDYAYINDPVLDYYKDYYHKLGLQRPGASFVDIAVPDRDGNSVQLSSVIGCGKYVLLDFWASWCGPCMREMPNVVEAYGKYHDKGFEIVGISLDENREAWLGAVERKGMTWLQLSELAGWSTKASTEYGIRFIPNNILYSPEGKVVASCLMGEELQAKLAEIFE